MERLFTTREIAEYLHIHEKMVYSLVSEKGLPATKVTGKWLFPVGLVDQWIENSTTNYPKSGSVLPPYQGLLIITGSNDPLLERTLALYNTLHPDHIAVFGNLGSMGGVRALRRNLCHIATSHLLQDSGSEYNFDAAASELAEMPAMINFCRREQGLLVATGNPKGIASVADLGRPGIRIVNRSLGTGTRLLLDVELRKAGIRGDKIAGYDKEVPRHLDVGMEILSGRADAGPGIRAIAGLLGLGFIPLLWERYDLMVSKERFFEEGIQRFLGLLPEPRFRDLAGTLEGYDLSLCGKMVFPRPAPNTDPSS